MTNLIIYSLEIATSLALFYTAYRVFLKKETFFKLNRFYLMCSVVIALLTPLLNISIAGQNSFIARYVTLPIAQYEQRLTGNSNAIAVNHDRSARETIGAVTNRKPEDLNQQDNSISESAQIAPLSSTDTSSADKTINWLTIVSLIYFTGAAFFLIRFLANVIRIFAYARKNETQKMFGMKVIILNKNTSPFSFLNFIFIGHNNYPDAELAKIISHEKVHIQQKHSIDIILLELLLAFQWFNPFVWLYKRDIKITHEYLADQGTLNSGIDLPDYHYSLLNQALSANNFEIASNYNVSVKTRIAMMMKKRSSKLSALKLIVALPILVFLFSAFAFKATAKNEVAAGTTNTLTAYGDSSIKKVSVPVEYLKLLEGEYISTNETRARKIKFTETMGELIGNDNGYIYKIIPIGGNKFVNPDDRAAFVFDTKDKNAITILFFDKINLKKVKTTRTSIAFSLTNFILKEGIPATLAQYKKLKDSSSYYLQEGEMNYAGYQLLQAGKAQEAVAIFKLNTEAFPNSYNVYDSYGESLLAVGDKALALENYKKSLQLNPGNVSAIKVLEEAGVNIDSPFKVTVEYLKLLEGDYLSTNQPGSIRKIVFKEKDGVLTANDDGYKYKLVPVAEDKFINPDDGASFVFNTKNKNAVTLLLFGKINLEKVTAANGSPVAKKQVAKPEIKKIDVSVDYLRLLVGEYVSTNAKNRVRRIRFEEINGVLIGDDNGYVYTLIPVAEGKFINPDDGQSLVFDTKNKAAITLLLFGTINLNKVN